MESRLAALRRLLRLHISWLTVVLLGRELVSKEDLAELKKYGKLSLEDEVSFIERAFSLGHISAISKKQEYSDLTLEGLSRREKKKYSSIDKLAIREAKIHANRHMQSIVDDVVAVAYDNVNQATSDLVSDVMSTVTDELAIALAEKKSAKELASKLVTTFNAGMKKEWQRFATTELHRAKVRGAAMAIANKVDIYKKSDGIDSEVSIVPNKGACKDCLALYLDEKGNPRVVKLKELVSRGTNVSAKHTRNKEGLHNHWKAVMPPAHPNCYCTLVYVPPGMAWDNGKLVVQDSLEYGNHLSKAVDQGSMSATITPPGPKKTQGFKPAKAPSLPGLPAPGNDPGPGAPANPASQQTTAAPSAQTTKEQEQSSPENLMPCPYGGGVDCVKHGGTGGEHHKPDGESMKAHMKYREKAPNDEQDVAEAMNIAGTSEWGKRPQEEQVIRDHLSSGKIIHSQDVKDAEDVESGICDSKKVAIADNGNGCLKATLYDERENIPYGTSHAREVAGSNLFNGMGMSYCPPTVYRNVDGNPGSNQYWLEEFNTAYAHILEAKEANTMWANEMINLSANPEQTRNQLEDISIMDMMMNNTDRHMRNLMVSDDFSEVKAIDHGLSFGMGLTGYKASVHQDFNANGMKIKLEGGLKERFENTSLGDIKRMIGSDLADWEVGQTFLRMRYVQHVQEEHGHLPYSEFKLKLGREQRSITHTSEENLLVNNFRNRKQPDQKFEDFCIDFIDSVSADSKHPDHESAKALNEMGVFMHPSHKTTKDVHEYRKNGDHIQYEIAIRAHKDALAQETKKYKEPPTSFSYRGDSARTLREAENPAAAIQRRKVIREEEKKRG